MNIKRALLSALLLCMLSFIASAQNGAATIQRQESAYPPPAQGDYLIRDFHFRSGETLPELKLHYATIGTPVRDAQGVVRNAVLIMHGTGGTGNQSLSPRPQLTSRERPGAAM